MRILAHRGTWQERPSQNTLSAFEASWRAGYGIETDVRDAAGELVIAHDPPGAGIPALTLDAMLKAYTASPEFRKTPLALNIKADGLASLLKAALDAYNVTEYFVFDASNPDMRHYLRLSCPTFTRQSDVEPDPVFLEDCAGVWLDCFETVAWLTPEIVSRHLQTGKQLAIVSPELHGRDPDSFWHWLRQVLQDLELLDSPKIMLCTDQPQQAEGFFHVQPLSRH